MRRHKSLILLIVILVSASLAASSNSPYKFITNIFTDISNPSISSEYSELECNFSHYFTDNDSFITQLDYYNQTTGIFYMAFSSSNLENIEALKILFNFNATYVEDTAEILLTLTFINSTIIVLFSANFTEPRTHEGWCNLTLTADPHSINITKRGSYSDIGAIWFRIGITFHAEIPIPVKPIPPDLIAVIGRSLREGEPVIFAGVIFILFIEIIDQLKAHRTILDWVTAKQEGLRVCQSFNTYYF